MRKKSNGTRNSGQKGRSAVFGGHEARVPLAVGRWAFWHRCGSNRQTEVLDEDGRDLPRVVRRRRGPCRQAHLRPHGPVFAGRRHVRFHREAAIRKSKSVSPRRATSLPAASRNPPRLPKSSAARWSRSRPGPRRRLPLRRKRSPRPTPRPQRSLRPETALSAARGRTDALQKLIADSSNEISAWANNIKDEWRAPGSVGRRHGKAQRTGRQHRRCHQGDQPCFGSDQPSGLERRHRGRAGRRSRPGLRGRCR